MITIVTIVEGPGEVESMRPLITRVAALTHPTHYVHVLRPIPQPRGSLLKAGGVERAVELAARKLAGALGGILILIDADRECPVKLYETLLQRARTARSDQRISVVIAREEYEAWFLAAASSLAGYSGMQLDLADHPDPESRRDAKGWLAAHRQPPTYSPTADQASFTSRFDLELAGRARSFRKLRQEVERLCSLCLEDHE